MAVTLDALLHEPALGARTLVSTADAGSHPIAWVHNSDLLDPTPWLADDQVLLTDGLQFLNVDDRATFDEYVQRLVQHGIVALGHSVGVVHGDVPSQLLAACEASGLTLFSVPESTPFIAFVQFVAQALADEQRAELEWSLQAQGAVARAALRPDGLAAVLRELSRQLDCWVTLFDASGKETHSEREPEVAQALKQRVRAEAERLLRNGRRAAARIDEDGIEVSFQTIGRHNQLRGVVALGSSRPMRTQSARIVESVIAIASVALEQSQLLNAARMNLRSGLLELLMEGSLDTARAAADKVWGALPSAPIRVMSCSQAAVSKQLEDELELRAMELRGQFFFARRNDDELVMISSADAAAEHAAHLAQRGFRIGASGAGPWSEAAALYREAGIAQRLATRDRAVVEYDSVFGTGFLSMLEQEAADVRARRLLEPVTTRPDADELLRSAQVWLEANGMWDPAAKALGIHRHTLRARIDLIAQLTTCELAGVEGRFELWTALQVFAVPARTRDE